MKEKMMKEKEREEKEDLTRVRRKWGKRANGRSERGRKQKKWGAWCWDDMIWWQREAISVWCKREKKGKREEKVRKRRRGERGEKIEIKSGPKVMKCELGIQRTTSAIVGWWQLLVWIKILSPSLLSHSLFPFMCFSFFFLFFHLYFSITFTFLSRIVSLLNSYCLTHSLPLFLFVRSFFLSLSSLCWIKILTLAIILILIFSTHPIGIRSTT